ncbi:hypothetical protein HNY73_021889 [Argiope bruennichi]|uniref:Uncharacterized protein n=1 Tax=Argiope bruennichi TaxID=94029 RepID=A0A8T0DZX7_ARGBR|nr:hypothetical protein HNY73_021889 [Argiope bruennichi]
MGVRIGGKQPSCPGGCDALKCQTNRRPSANWCPRVSEASTSGSLPGQGPGHPEDSFNGSVEAVSINDNTLPCPFAPEPE